MSGRYAAETEGLGGVSARPPAERRKAGLVIVQTALDQQWPRPEMIDTLSMLGLRDRRLVGVAVKPARRAEHGYDIGAPAGSVCALRPADGLTPDAARSPMP